MAEGQSCFLVFFFSKVCVIATCLKQKEKQDSEPQLLVLNYPGAFLHLVETTSGLFFIILSLKLVSVIARREHFQLKLTE